MAPLHFSNIIAYRIEGNVLWCTFSNNFKFFIKIKFRSSNFRIFLVLQATPPGTHVGLIQTFQLMLHVSFTIKAMVRGYHIYSRPGATTCIKWMVGQANPPPHLTQALMLKTCDREACENQVQGKGTGLKVKCAIKHNVWGGDWLNIFIIRDSYLGLRIPHQTF